jgi:hypothetical protein
VHPLLRYLLDAVDGRFPPDDGGVTYVPVLPDGRSAVVSFTGHAVIATGLLPAAFVDPVPDGFGDAVHPRTLMRLAGPGGRVGVLDVTLAATGVGGGVLPQRDDLDDHPRVRHARALRRDVRVHGDDRGLVTVSSGLAGRREISVEVLTGAPPGSGRALVGEAVGLAARGERVFAAVSPGNARSLRAFLAAGFVPLGSEIIVTPA